MKLLGKPVVWDDSIGKDLPEEIHFGWGSDHEVVIMVGGKCDGMMLQILKTTLHVHFPTPHGILEYHRCDFDRDGMVVFQQDATKDSYGFVQEVTVR